MNPEKTILQKQEMRKSLKQIITEKRGNSDAIVQQLEQFLRNKPSCRTIALFAPLPGEVDLMPLMKKIDRRWVFPKVLGQELRFHEIKKQEADLKLGAFDIWEPVEGTSEVAPNQIDLFLCPGLGFDLRGGRIGRGKGFYDRALAAISPHALKIGICFPYQIVGNIFMEEHDVRMDSIFTGKSSARTPLS